MNSSEDITKAINYLERKYNSGDLSDSEIARVQSALDKYSSSTDISDDAELSLMYELQSFLHALNGDNNSSYNFIVEAAKLNNLNFFSKTGADIYDNYVSEANIQNEPASLHQQPEINKKTSTKVWQFFLFGLLGLIVLAGLQAISVILNLVGIVLFFYELYFITTGKVTIIDIIFQYKYGKAIFWTITAILIVLVVYVPQKWGEWTAGVSNSKFSLIQIDG